jgi:hypothetical protein
MTDLSSSIRENAPLTLILSPQWGERVKVRGVFWQKMANFKKKIR